ncbi:MAG TPA: nitroreductase family protein [Spirochaetia bacterium]|nr:nitroreductase family protein [Spirochaetia bacterium]
MGMLEAIERRKSVRAFKHNPIQQEKLNNILEAGRIAPSAKNRQPWRFIVIQDKEKRKRIEEAAYGQEHVGQAPVIIAACSTNIDYRMPNGQLSYPIDISFAVSFMMIQAAHENIGSCVITTFDEAEVKEILTVPYSMRVVMLLLLGHPAEEVASIRERKQLHEITAKDHW